MPVQLRRSAVAWQLPRRVHLDHRQGRLRGREARRPRRRPPWNMARGVHLGHGTQMVLIDGRATPAQRKALETLGKGEAGGPFAVFASVTERWLPTIVAPFDVRLNGIRSTIRVDAGKVYHLALSRIKNPVTGDEEELYLDKPTGFTAKRSELGMSTVSRFKAPGLEYDNSGQYAEFSTFSYTGP